MLRHTHCHFWPKKTDILNKTFSGEVRKNKMAHFFHYAHCLVSIIHCSFEENLLKAYIKKE